MLVCVYGTLKRGYDNNIILSTGKARFVSEAVVRGYKLFHWGFPVAAPEPESNINAEVWDISGEHEAITLKRLDSLEGYYTDDEDDSMYHRREVIAHTDNGQLQVNMYVGNPLHWGSFVGMKECPKDDGNTYTWSR